MPDLEKLTDLLDDMQRSGTSYFDYEMYGVRVPDSVPNEDVAKYLLKHDITFVHHGFWIEKQELIPWCEDDVDVFYECSICGSHNIGESPYCPECGAKMLNK